MRAHAKYPFRPDYAIPAGETLQETLDALGMSQADLAERTGLTTKTINLIVKGTAPITPETALHFERVLGTPASFWNNREQQYREALARLAEEGRLQGDSTWLKRIPYAAMVKAGWVTFAKDPIAQLKIVLNFFGVGGPKQWEAVWGKPLVAYRDSKAFQKDPGAVAAWLRKGELEAQCIETKPFEDAKLRAVLKQARAMTRLPREEFVPKLRTLCADAGVALVLVRELPGTRTHGATRWLTASKALIQLSFRYKSNDQLWFSFYHEAGHILLHGKREMFLEENGGGSQKEDEANKFAADWLIPPVEYGRFRESGEYRSHVGVETFARQVGIAPGIVVGRLQFEKKLPRNQMNDLKVWLEWNTAK